MTFRTIALVPLRGGSKSIPKKNIKMLAGRPLCAWTLEAAAKCKSIDAVYVSTDSKEIAKVVTDLDLGITIIDRPSHLADDAASTESVILHFLEQMPSFERLVTIQATSPLLESWHLTEALALFQKGGYDSLLSTARTKQFFWTDDGLPLNYDPCRRPRRQDFPGCLVETGAFYITKTETALQFQCRLGGRIGLYEMPQETAIEIDESGDWILAETILRNRLEERK